MELSGWNRPAPSPIRLSREIERAAEALEGVALAEVRVGDTGVELLCMEGRLAGVVIAEAVDLDGLLERVNAL